jgi:peptidoglycan/xylan/chitin deacetylase (PgdA/CDA1 family)
MYFKKTFFNIVSYVALVVTAVLAQEEGPGFVFKCSTPGQVALTYNSFSEPADSTLTFPIAPKLLENLAAAKVPATFFVLGENINKPGGKEVLKAVFNAGHQVALFSNTHKDMNEISPEDIRNEFELNIKAVFDTIGVFPTMAR